MNQLQFWSFIIHLKRSYLKTSVWTLGNVIGIFYGFLTKELLPVLSIFIFSSSSSDGLQALAVCSVFPHPPAVLSEEGTVPPVLPGGPAELSVHPARQRRPDPRRQSQLHLHRFIATHCLVLLPVYSRSSTYMCTLRLHVQVFVRLCILLREDIVIKLTLVDGVY